MAWYCPWDLIFIHFLWISHSKVFLYSPPHDVLEVTKADYDSCQKTSPLQAYTDGKTVITLSSPGNRYFICGFLNHCSLGMKLQADTLATSAAPPPSTTPTTPPPTNPKVAVPPLPSIPITPSILPKIANPPLPEVGNPLPSIPTAPSTLPKIAVPPLPSKPTLDPLKPPSLAPLGSLPNVSTPIVLPLKSPAVPPSGSTSSPSSSSGNRGHLLSKFTTGMWFGLLMLLAL